MAVLHDWAFVTARFLLATSACGTALTASELRINHLPQITKEAVSSLTDCHLFVLQDKYSKGKMTWQEFLLCLTNSACVICDNKGSESGWFSANFLALHILSASCACARLVEGWDNNSPALFISPSESRAQHQQKCQFQSENGRPQAG